MLHVLFALAFPPLLLGVIAKTKAWFAGRVGPPVLQPYYDLVKLFQKGSVFSTTTTWVFRAGPVVGTGDDRAGRVHRAAGQRPADPATAPCRVRRRYRLRAT